MASIVLPELPYSKDALEPHISANTLGFHYDKHHAGYVAKLNGMIGGTRYEGQSLESIITMSAGQSSEAGVFNNAAQIWNHTFFWNSMSPSKTAPTGALLEAIERDFGSVDQLKADFKAAAVAQFGSGWAWLVREGDTLKVAKTSNAETPLTMGQTPLATIDVWEHAYYLDYQNRRPDFVGAVLDNLLNWDFIAKNFAA